MLRRLALAASTSFAFVACGATNAPVVQPEVARPSLSVATPVVVQPEIATLSGPFRDVTGQTTAFAAPYLDAALPERTRAIDEDAAANLDIYDIYDDLRSPGEKLFYEVDGCLFVIVARRTTLLSPRTVFDDAASAPLLEALHIRRFETTDSNLVVGEKQNDNIGLEFVVFERDYYAIEAQLGAEPIFAESFDEDPHNDNWRDGPRAAEHIEACERRAKPWLEAVVRTLRVRESREIETQIIVPSPTGINYTVDLPENATGYNGEWYHGVESYLAVRTEYGEPECGSILVSATDGGWLDFYPPQERPNTMRLWGSRLSVYPDPDASGDCPERVAFVPRRNSPTYHNWLMRLRGTDETIAPLLTAMRGGRRR